MDEKNLSWHNVVFLLATLVVSVNTSWLAIIPCAIAYTVLLMVIAKLTGKELTMNGINQTNDRDQANAHGGSDYHTHDSYDSGDSGDSGDSD